MLPCTTLLNLFVPASICCLLFSISGDKSYLNVTHYKKHSDGN
jgi:hypothetical protein